MKMVYIMSGARKRTLDTNQQIPVPQYISEPPLPNLEKELYVQSFKFNMFCNGKCPEPPNIKFDEISKRPQANSIKFATSGAQIL